MEAHDAGLQPSQVDPDAKEDEGTNVTDIGALSILDQIKEQREVLKEEDHHLDLDIPGYNGMLVARYKPVRYEIIEAIVKKVDKDKSGVSKNLLSSTDTLIQACDQVMLRVKGELQPIPSGNGEVGIAYDVRLARILGFEATTAREVVAGVFGNEFGVIDHNVRYSLWLRDVTREVDDTLLGE